jgi:catechol 2,3-dioxygenase-like lactoylglutathione lyase family enzyme
MSSPHITQEHATQIPTAAAVDLKLEIVIIPVADVDRAKRFYESLGWRLDGDFSDEDDWRGIQFTPPGSGCSVIFGKNLTPAAPGSAQGLYLIVSDIEAAHQELLRRGVKISEVFHGAGKVHAGTDEPYLFGRRRVNGPDPEHGSYRSFASFSDPDGNGWLLQEVKTRLPGRGFSLDVESLTELLRETEEHHGKYEPTAPKHHWSEWYAAYMAARVRGRTPEEAAEEGKLRIEGTRVAGTGGERTNVA